MKILTLIKKGFGQIRTVMNNVKKSTLNCHSRRPFVIILLILSFPFALTLQKAYVYFIQIKNDTISLTNIGFAMMIGLSSVLFNWARSIDAQIYSDAFNRINKIAAQTLMGGVLFMLASFFKYFSMYESGNAYSPIKINENPDLWMYIVSLALVLIAFTTVYIVICEFIVVYLYLWKHVYSGQSSDKVE